MGVACLAQRLIVTFVIQMGWLCAAVHCQALLSEHNLWMSVLGSCHEQNYGLIIAPCIL